MAYSEFYVQTTGSNLNAGSDANDAAEFTFTSGDFNADATGSTHVFTAAGADLSGVAVGEWASVYADGATVTGFVGRITAVDNTAKTITISSTAKSGTAPTDGTGNRSIKVGGAWKGPNGTEALPFNFVQTTMVNSAGDDIRVNIKAGTYSITGALTHGTTSSGPILWEGYQTTPGDLGTAPVFDGSTTGSGTQFIMFTFSCTGNIFKNLDFNKNYAGTGPAGAGSGMIDITGVHNLFFRCRATNGWRAGWRVAGASTLMVECEGHNNNNDDASDFGAWVITEESTFIRCIAHHNDVAGGDNDNIGFVIQSSSGEPVTMIDCIASNHTKHGFQIQGASSTAFLIRCISANNLGAGFYTTGTANSQLYMEGCISILNGTYGIQRNTAVDGTLFIRNQAFYNNTTAQLLNIDSQHLFGTITLSANPFVDSTNGDFRLNTTSGGGAELRGTGLGAFKIDTAEFSSGANTVSYPDIGAVQHQEAASTGGPGPRIMRVGNAFTPVF